MGRSSASEYICGIMLAGVIQNGHGITGGIGINVYFTGTWYVAYMIDVLMELSDRCCSI
jgi:hypothetical protein